MGLPRSGGAALASSVGVAFPPGGRWTLTSPPWLGGMCVFTSANHMVLCPHTCWGLMYTIPLPDLIQCQQLKGWIGNL